MSTTIIRKDEYTIVTSKPQLFKIIECDVQSKYPHLIKENIFSLVKERYYAEENIHGKNELKLICDNINQYFSMNINNCESRIISINKIEKQEKVPIWYNSCNLVVGCEFNANWTSNIEGKQQLTTDFLYQRFLKFKKKH